MRGFPKELKFKFYPNVKKVPEMRILVSLFGEWTGGKTVASERPLRTQCNEQRGQWVRTGRGESRGNGETPSTQGRFQKWRHLHMDQCMGVKKIMLSTATPGFSAWTILSKQWGFFWDEKYRGWSRFLVGGNKKFMSNNDNTDNRVNWTQICLPFAF